MKQHQNLLFILFFINSLNHFVIDACHSSDDISHTFFSVHPLFQSVSPERDPFFRNSFIEHDENLQNKFEVTFFGGVSHDSDRIARFFLPNGKCSILVAGDNAPNADKRDIDAIHLNIDYENKAFESCVTFAPKQTVFGAGFRYRQWFSRSSDKHFWFEISFPVMRVENNMCLKEKIINPGDTLQPIRVANATQAFKQSGWKYGRIPAGCTISAVGVGDIELKFGWEAVHTDTTHVETYVGGVFPTGTRPTGCFVFEPIVGNNHHWGFITGSAISIKGWERGDHSITGIVEFNRQFLFKGNEMRSFDIVGKPWGRYMEVYANKAAAQVAADNTGDPTAGDRGEPGINYLTKCVCVEPGYVVTLNTGYLYSYHSFRVEGGYNYFSRQKEKITVDNFGCNADQSPALVSSKEGGYTTRARTINENYECTGQNVDNYQALCASDLDISSAAHPAVLSHTFYLVLGYQWEEQEHPVYLSGGLSYEFGSNNAALSRILGWAKLGFTF